MSTETLETSDRLAARWRRLGLIVTAHVEMLLEQGLIEEPAAESLMATVDSVQAGTPPAGSLLDLIVTFDERLDALTPPGLAGTARVGRGSFDVIATAARLETRELLTDAWADLADFRSSLVDFAGSHVVTLTPAYAGASPAQPTSYGHYLAGLLAPLGRSADRFRLTLEHVDQSPMGAVALASTGMPVDRERMAALLGFSGCVENTFDAVAAVDHFGDAAWAIRNVATAINRWLRDLKTWIRTEPASFMLPDEDQSFVPDLPQLRFQKQIDELVEQAAALIDATSAIARTVEGIEYGPFVAVDRLLDTLNDAASQHARLLNGTRDLIDRQMIVNRAYLANRAGRDYTTSSDLADFLMIEEQIDPGAARMIADLVVANIRERGVETSAITPETIDTAALLILGREVGVEFEAISRYLAPRRFIERRTATGSPSPAATRAWLGNVQAAVEEDRARVQSARERHTGAASYLQDLAREASSRRREG